MSILTAWLAKRAAKRIQFEAEMQFWADRWSKIKPGMSLAQVAERLAPVLPFENEDIGLTTKSMKMLHEALMDRDRLIRYRFGRNFLKGAVYVKNGHIGQKALEGTGFIQDFHDTPVVRVEYPYICEHYIEFFPYDEKHARIIKDRIHKRRDDELRSTV